MSEQKEIDQYIKIKPPFSLDKWWEQAEPSSPVGTFFLLENYIPKKDHIITRKGISEFTFV